MDSVAALLPLAEEGPFSRRAPVPRAPEVPLISTASKRAPRYSSPTHPPDLRRAPWPRFGL